MKRKLVAGLLALSMMAGVMTGCSSNTGTAETATDTETKTVTVWAMGEEGKRLPQMAEAFEEENPDINIEVQALPWDQAHDKLLTAVASGNGPDIIQMGTSWIPEFADAGILMDLSSYTADYSNIDQGNFYESSLATTMYDDAYVAVPWYVDTRVLYYRTDILEEVGYPEGPATWDELYDAASQLSARGEGQYGISLDPKDQFFAVIFGWQNDAGLIEDGAANFSDPKFIEAIEYLKRFFDEGLANKYSDIDIIQTFKDGREPMFISGPWMINIINDVAPEIEGQWTARTLPSKENNMSFVGGSNWTVFHNSKNVDEALMFIDFMSEPENQFKWMEISNTLPSRVEAWDDPRLADDEFGAVFGEQLQNASPAPFILEWEAIAQELNAAFERINLADADPVEEMKKLDEKADKLLGN